MMYFVAPMMTGSVNDIAHDLSATMGMPWLAGVVYGALRFATSFSRPASPITSRLTKRWGANFSSWPHASGDHDDSHEHFEAGMPEGAAEPLQPHRPRQ